MTSHLTLEDSLEQPFLWWFWWVTSVQVWREGTVGSKHVQLLEALCFYHLEKRGINMGSVRGCAVIWGGEEPQHQALG